MLFVALVFQLLSFSIHSIHGYPQSYYGRSLGPWSGGGTGYGNIFKNDNINVGLGGQGGTIVTKEYKPDGMVVQSNQWNKGMNGNVGFMKQVGGSEGIYGQSGPTYIMGQKQGMGWLGGGLGAGGNTFGGTTLVTQQGGDGSYIYSKQKNIGMNGYTGLGATGGGKGSYVFGCPYAGGCGSGGVRAYKGVGLNGGLNANKGYTVIKTVGDNGSYQKQTMSTWGLGGNLGSSVGMGVDGGWKANYRPVGRSMGRAAYYDEPVEVVEDVIQPVQPSPPRQHPYLRTLEGMYSREMDPQASIIMIDDPVVVIMPDDEAGGGGGGSGASTTPSSSSTTAGGSSTTAASTTAGGSSTTAASTTAAESTTAASTTEAATTTEATTTEAA